MIFKKFKKHKALGLFLAVTLLVSSVPVGSFTVLAGDSTAAETNVWDGRTASKFASGKGSKTDPYIIETGAQLAYLAKQVNSGTSYSGKYIKLANNINLDNRAWTPIGSYASSNKKYFEGSFDGNKMTVSGLNIKNAVAYSALFGLARNASITDLTIAKSEVTGNGSCVAAVCAYAVCTVFSGCETADTVTVDGAESYLGGICAYAVSRCEFSACTNKASLTVSDDASVYAGGICGYMYNSGSITYCVNSAEIVNNGKTDEKSGTGGICGALYSGASFSYEIKNCKNLGEIKGNINTGGIVGCGNDKLEGCLNTAAVSGIGRVGGIVGYAIGDTDDTADTIFKCSKTANVTATEDSTINEQYIGGISGYQSDYTTEHCYNAAEVKASTDNSYVGGISGYISCGSISSCHNYGALINASWYAGGIAVCGDDSTVTNCYYLEGTQPTEAQSLHIGGSEMSLQDFANGKVCTALQGKTAEQIWGQSLSGADADLYPVFYNGQNAVVLKTEVVLGGITRQDGEYNGEEHTGYTGSISGGAYTGDYTVTYTGRDGTVYQTSTQKPKNVGKYTVTVAIPSDNTEYEGSIAVDFEITAGEMSGVSASGYYGSYDGKAHSITVTAPEGADVSYSTDGKTYTDTDPEFSQAGVYTVYYKAEKDNYNEVCSSATVNIEKTKLTVKAKDNTIIYGQEPAANGVVYSGFVNGENEDVISKDGLAFDFSYTRYGDAGDSYTITPKGLCSDNYDFEYQSGVLTVEQKQIEISWSNTDAQPYDGTSKLPDAYAVGLVNGDNCTLSVGVEESTDGAGVVCGTYTAKVIGISNSNYKLPDDITVSFTVLRGSQDDIPDAEGVDESIMGKADGKITGVDSSMEYRREGEDDYTAIDGTQLTDLCAGTYYVRYAANENYAPSLDRKVKIGAGRELSVALLTVDGCTVSGKATAKYGESYVFTVSVSEGYERTDAFEVKANGMALTAAADGSYEVKTVSGDVSLEIFGIDKKESTAPITLPDASDTADATDTAAEIDTEETLDTAVLSSEPQIPQICDMSDIPDTKDTSELFLWAAVLFVSGIGIAATLLYGKNKKAY